jgi:hypothetical protein
MRASLLAAFVLVSACTVTAPDEDPVTGDDGTAMPTPEPDPDPSPAPDPDPDPGASDDDDCPPADMGSFDGLKDPSGLIDRMNPDDPESPAVRIVGGLLDEYSAIEIGLWDGYGAFLDSPAAPADYPIGGDDADPSTCGLCIEVTWKKGEVERRLFATGGAVSIESVDGRLTGSADSLSFEEFDADDQEVTGGCRALVRHVAFDVALETQ